MYATDWDDHPSEGSAEKTPHHPEGGLDAEVRTTVLVADELGVVGK